MERLRVLIANERRDRLALLAKLVEGLGHEVIAQEIDVACLGPVTSREHPDVALVGLGASPDHALGMIDVIVREASCPVIAVLATQEPAYIREAASRGIFAYILDNDADELQGAIDITLKRFAEYHDLQGAFGRRALIEQAKGILMARHHIGADAAFDMLGEPGCGAERANDVAARLVALPAGHTASVGVATFDGSEPIADLFRRADDALYLSKVERSGIPVPRS